MLGDALKKLEVAVKGGGSIVSHPPVFSKDSGTLYIIQNNTLLLHDTKTGRCIDKFCTPSASPIANVSITADDNVILVFTSSGNLLHVEVPSLTVVKTTEVVWRAKNFSGAINFTNFVWPETISPVTPISPSYFFLSGYSPDSSTHPTLYSVQIHSSSDTQIRPLHDSDPPPPVSQLPYKFECKGIVANLHAIATGRNGCFVAATQPDHLFVKDMTSNSVRWHKAGTRTFTCVAVHPTEWICATGDDSGRILVWSNLFEKAAVKTIYHWHTLPVSDLSFSMSGTQVYSVGGECTLVKWDLNNTGNKRTLPRLGLPIRHVARSGRDELVAISQADNSVKLINVYNEVSAQIQNLTQCYIPDGVDDINISEYSLGGEKIFQAGLHLDPNNQSLIANGKPGQLQCYSFKEDRHLYNLDITQQNFITAERNNPIPNSDVTHIAFSNGGAWLASAECRRDSKREKCTELRLKFWKFERERQIFVLNTSIDWPHEVGISSLKMQPIPESDPTLVAVTTGLDNTFKTWAVTRDESIHGKSEWWNCEFIGSYRNLRCGPASFSEDGSLLTIAFERTVTVWATDNNELKLTLCHSKLGENISLLEFGSHQSSNLIVACSSQNMAVWDVITSSLLWVAPFHAETLVVDPYSNLAAAFSSKHHLIFFSPDNAEPLAVHKNVSSSHVISALFVPHEKSFQNVKLKSTLFFVNSSQELCAFLPPVDQAEPDETIRISADARKSVLTPFAQLIAEKTVYENLRKPTAQLSSNQVGLEGYKILRDIMDQSPHTMPSLTYFCSRLLQALSTRRTPGDHLAEVEKAAQLSFKKGNRKYVKSSLSFNLEDDEDHEDFEDFPRTASTQDKGQNCLQEVPPFTPDLDLVANDNLTWVDKIFEKE